MLRVIDFLRRLDANNNREWFAAHKDEYVAVQGYFNAFAGRMIAAIGKFDPTVASLTVKDCTYRIYRDTRFSADKTPYKTHMGCFVCREGKKSGYSGYYLHVGVGGGTEYPVGHMLASGNYCIEPRALQILREDIVMGGGDFRRTIEAADSSFYLDKEYSLKRPPKGYDDTTPEIDLVKNRAFCLVSELSDDEMVADTLLDMAVERFSTTRPFIDYINRAIEYSREEE